MFYYLKKKEIIQHSVLLLLNIDVLIKHKYVNIFI